VAELAGTRLLAVPVDCFDVMLERDPEFARRVLVLESRRLRGLTQASVKGTST
jgi:CRP-like cAMP-binding protein